MIAVRQARTLALALLVVTWSALGGAVSALAQAPRQVVTVAFGLDGDQGVFQREAAGAAAIVSSRFGHGGPVIVRYNDKHGGNATIGTLAATLRSVGARMGNDDVLALILTSHGSSDGLLVKAGPREAILSPSALAAMLAGSGIKDKVVIISACFSGVFLRPLASPDTLVITAADAQHSSFGCSDEARWTYFGDAFFNVALRREKSFGAAYRLARSLIRKRELAQGFTPSNPQMAGGENVEPRLLAGR